LKSNTNCTCVFFLLKANLLLYFSLFVTKYVFFFVLFFFEQGHFDKQYKSFASTYMQTYVKKKKKNKISKRQYCLWLCPVFFPLFFPKVSFSSFSPLFHNAVKSIAKKDIDTSFFVL
jgi:hypothetical protein